MSAVIFEDYKVCLEKMRIIGLRVVRERLLSFIIDLINGIRWGRSSLLGQFSQ